MAQTTSIVRHRRTPDPGKPPPSGTLEPGMLAVEMSTQPYPRLWIGVPQSIDPTGRRLVGGGGGGAAVSSGVIAPLNPIDNQLWWDATGGQLYLRYNDGNSAQWVIASPSLYGGGTGAASVGPRPPIAPAQGQQWWDTISGQMYIWYVDGGLSRYDASGQWVICSPSFYGGGGGEPSPGPPGPAGPQGVPGQAATITIGATTTGAPGTSANVANIGTSSAAVLNFTIPRGDPGTGGSGTAVSVGASPPLSPAPGQQWWDTNSGQLYIWYNDGSSSQWVIASPSFGGGASTAAAWGSITGTLSAQTDLASALNTKQAALVSGFNIKTVNGNSLLGAGDIAIGGSGGGLPLTGGSLSGALTLDAAGTTSVPQLQMRRADGSLASPTITQNSRQLGLVEWQGYSSAGWRTAGSIQCITTAAWNGASPVRMDFRTTRSGATATTLAMYIGSNGGLVVGNAGGGDRGPGTINAQVVYGDAIAFEGDTITAGPNNSGGPNYRVLVVPNA